MFPDVKKFAPVIAVVIPMAILLFICHWQKSRLTRADLVIDHSDAGEWIDFSNRWLLPDDEACDPDDPNYRPGVLFQIGYYAKSRRVYDGIEIHLDDGTVDPYDDFVWINIVGDYPGRSGDVIEGENIFALFPNTVFDPSCDEDFTSTCFRNRLINSHMTRIGALITYWQGDDGYRVSAVQTMGECYGNEFTFTFNDSFGVDVYEVVDDAVTFKKHYDSKELSQILVTTVLGSSDKNETQPLPWDYP